MRGNPQTRYVGCPRCSSLLYVLKSSEREKCPSCSAIVNPQEGTVIKHQPMDRRWR